MTTPGTPARAGPYPLRLSAELDGDLSRGLWIVKWLLAIPHFIILVFLWIGFAFSTLGAFFAILFVGRFPRVLFDFNVGVLRWSWRVSYYAYGALGTDRYPPFSLGAVADYPARLEVDYPERLSRGLVLVKWWLLALPHYLIVSIFVGGGFMAFGEAADEQQPASLGGGLIGLLVVIAAIALLFTARYPRGLFDLLLGLNRWVMRVTAYAALMTDEYPPFRLDQGGAADTPNVGPGGAPGDEADGTAPALRQAIPVILGIICLAVATMLLLVAATLWTVKKALPDDEGFFTAPIASCQVDSYAIASEPIRLDLDGPQSVTPEAVLGDGKVTATSRDGSPIFIGLADSRSVEVYLGDTARSTLQIDDDDADGDLRPVCRTVGGQSPSTTPTSLSIWTTYATGPGPQTITWPFEDGDWTVVIMNLDASPGLDVAVDAGATFPGIGAVLWAIVVSGGVFLLLGVGLLVGPPAVRSIRRRGERQAP